MSLSNAQAHLNRAKGRLGVIEDEDVTAVIQDLCKALEELLKEIKNR